MILGLDVGGTQTDTVVLDGARVVAATKTPTTENLIETLGVAIGGALQEVDPSRIERLSFSTTLAINAIVQDRLTETGMLVSAGPGMDPRWFSVGPAYEVIEQGCLDHQGLEAMPLNKQEVMERANLILAKGIRAVGVVGKFSVRNPAHEMRIAQWVGDFFSHMALGYSNSGMLNFPRRIATTYLNASLSELHRDFSNALASVLKQEGLTGPRYILKPDGGTVSLDKAGDLPARTAQSGPAASVMGALALDPCEGVTLVLDIGGTTTDMAVIVNRLPLFNPWGIRLGPYQTLIRSLLTHSLGIGGDSQVRIERSGNIRIGPLRKGRPVALEGPAPTPTDAMIALKLLDVGRRDLAVSAMKALGASQDWDPEETSEKVLQKTAEIIAESARAFLYDINARPVYTIREVMEDQRITPTSVLVLGGPAPQLAPYVGRALGIPHRVPEHFQVANALGAAVARVTTAITIQADTQRGTVIIPEAEIQEFIDSRFGLEEAIHLGRRALQDQARSIGADTEAEEMTITEKQIFNMIRGYARAGRNIRLRMCLVPGLIPAWKRNG